jgi:glycosyltransferase involved in cell wall biosynthesis
MISVLIPTKNEERNLPGCLESIRWCDDVHVYDSGSTDRTAEIARNAGASVVQRPGQSDDQMFGGDEAQHKNWALHNIPFRYPWVLHIDADERVTPGLLQNMRAAVTGPGDVVAFEIQRRDFFLGTWLKHVQATPFYLRLFRPVCMRFKRLINPVGVPTGPTARIDGFLDHYPFNKGIAYWLERHNAYSTLEARQITHERRAMPHFSWTKAFTSKHFTERRFCQKQLFYRLPGRPFVKFALLYFFKRGFLDGTAGLTYAMLQSFYEYMIVLKTREFETAAFPTLSK